MFSRSRSVLLPATSSRAELFSSESSHRFKRDSLSGRAEEHCLAAEEPAVPRYPWG